MSAANDLWFVGDTFLAEIYHALSNLKHKAVTGKKQLPYICEYYNISSYMAPPNAVNKEVLSRFVNALVKALNESLKMPRLIIVVPDHDILKFVDYNSFGVKEIIRGAINWIINQMKRAVEAKQDNLSRRNPGAILAGEPKMIWVKMINRHGITGRSELLALRYKFNDALEDCLAQHENHFIMSLDKQLNGSEFFDRFNNLNGYGKSRYWRILDERIEQFEKKRISLRPHGHSKQNKEDWSKGHGKHTAY